MSDGANTLRELLEKGVEAGDFVGYDCIVAKDDEVLARFVGGYRQLVPREEKIDKDPVFDLASLTKPIATASSAMIAVDKGILDLNARVSELIPEAENLAGVRLSHLMSHRSGLPAWVPFYKEARDRKQMIKMLMSVKPDKPPGENEVYSDLGYMIIGLILERAFDKSLKGIARDNVFRPLGMKETSFLPGKALRGRAVATELTDEELPLVGVVHDENARAMGGVSGHAGLFGTARDLFRFCRMLIGEGELKGRRILSKRSLRLMITNQNRKIGGYYGYGWLTKKGDSLFGELCSDLSFAHSGFTGTYVAVDPLRHASAILLTSAVHPKRKEKSINAYRRAVFDLAISIGLNRE